MMKKQIVAIQDVYVPVQRRQTLDRQKVEALAESMLAKGQEAPIRARQMANVLSGLRVCIAWRPVRHSERQRSPFTWCKPVNTRCAKREVQRDGACYFRGLRAPGEFRSGSSRAFHSDRSERPTTIVSSNWVKPERDSFVGACSSGASQS